MTKTQTINKTAKPQAGFIIMPITNQQKWLTLRFVLIPVMKFARLSHVQQPRDLKQLNTAPSVAKSQKIM